MATTTEKPEADDPKADNPDPQDMPKSPQDTPKPATENGSSPDAKDGLKTLPLPEVEKKLESSPDGLTEAEAKKRLAQYGHNSIPVEKPHLIPAFLGKFWGAIPWILEAAVVLELVLHKRDARAVIVGEEERMNPFA